MSTSHSRDGFRPLVLCYHAVSDSWDDQLAVRPGALEAQVRKVLRSGYAPGTARDLLTGAGKIAHVTFDDAFCNIRGALELLVSLGVPATVFACPDYADGGRPLDVERLAHVEPEYERTTMDWGQLREIVDLGIEVGSHTCSHPRLPVLSDGELQRELRESKERLEDELGRPCPFFAYPFGDFDDRVRAAVKAAGYDGAFAETRVSSRFDPFGISRVGLFRKDWSLRAALKTSSLGQQIISRRASTP